MTETVPECADVTGGAEAKGRAPRETVWVVATAGFAARCLPAAVDVGVADLLEDSAMRLATWRRWTLIGEPRRVARRGAIRRTV